MPSLPKTKSPAYRRAFSSPLEWLCYLRFASAAVPAPASASTATATHSIMDACASPVGRACRFSRCARDLRYIRHDVRGAVRRFIDRYPLLYQALGRSTVSAGGLGSTHAHTCQPADRRQQHPRHMGRLTELGRHRRRINGLPGLSQTQIRITARAFCRYAVYFGRVYQKKETFLQGLLLLIVCQRPAAQRIAR